MWHVWGSIMWHHVTHPTMSWCHVRGDAGVLPSVMFILCLSVGNDNNRKEVLVTCVSRKVVNFSCMLYVWCWYTIICLNTLPVVYWKSFFVYWFGTQELIPLPKCPHVHSILKNVVYWCSLFEGSTSEQMNSPSVKSNHMSVISNIIPLHIGQSNLRIGNDVKSLLIMISKSKLANAENGIYSTTD